MAQPRDIVNLSEIDRIDRELIGKNAFELSELKYLKIPIRSGFVITSLFYKEFLEKTGIDKKIKEVEKIFHPSITDSMDKLFDPIRKEIMRSPIPSELTLKLHEAYRKLAGGLRHSPVDIFSSSNTGKSTTIRNIKGDANFILKIKSIWAGEPENLVSIVTQKTSNAKIKGTIITNDFSRRKELSDVQFQELISICKKIQKHFYFPMALDYTIENKKICVVRMKPFTGIIEYKSIKVTPNALKQQKALIKGIVINPGIATGPVRIFRKNHEFKIKNGDIIVTPILNSSTYSAIKNAKAVIIDSSLPKAIDKILYRKNIKIPTVEGAHNASLLLHNGHIVTVNGMTGEIYAGSLI